MKVSWTDWHWSVAASAFRNQKCPPSQSQNCRRQEAGKKVEAVAPAVKSTGEVACVQLDQE